MIGKVSYFGGQLDFDWRMNASGIEYDAHFTEGTALYEHAEAEHRPDLFIPRVMAKPGQGTFKRLIGLYFAMPFELLPNELSRDEKKAICYKFTNPKNGKSVVLTLVDNGPTSSTGRLFDISPDAMRLLDIVTDELVEGIPL